MKTIGVLGGLGPQATIDFEIRVHRFAQRVIPQQYNSGYPPMVVFYLRHPPVVMGDDYRPVIPLQPDPRLLEAAEKLGALADFLVITANGPHVFQGEIERTSGREVLSMIQVTLEEVRRRRIRRVGVLGYGEPRVYQMPLEHQGVEPVALTEALRERLDRAVEAVWEGRAGPAELQTTQEAVDWLRSQEVDGVILGCTEIPLLLEDPDGPIDLINPTQLLAEAAVRAAMD